MLINHLLATVIQTLTKLKIFDHFPEPPIPYLGVGISRLKNKKKHIRTLNVSSHKNRFSRR